MLRKMCISRCCCDGATIVGATNWDDIVTVPEGTSTATVLTDPFLMFSATGSTNAGTMSVRHWSFIPSGLPTDYYSQGFMVAVRQVPLATYGSMTITLPMSWKSVPGSPKPTHGFTIRAYNTHMAVGGGSIVTIDPNSIADYSSPGISWSIPSSVPLDNTAQNDPGDYVDVSTPNIASIINPVLTADTSRALLLLFEPSGTRTTAVFPPPFINVQASSYTLGRPAATGWQIQVDVS
jgi:hypothetical protein